MILITLPTLERAVYRVTNELKAVGLNKASDTPVVLTYLGLHYGYYQPEDAGKPGHIEIPAMSVTRLICKLTGYPCLSLAHVLRHEFAHALAYQNRKEIRAKDFSLVFDHHHEKEISSTYCKTKHVSHYAAYRPYEDFAETFAIYLKHGGRLPGTYQTEAIRKKFAFIDSLCSAIQHKESIKQ